MTPLAADSTLGAWAAVRAHHAMIGAKKLGQLAKHTWNSPSREISTALSVTAITAAQHVGLYLAQHHSMSDV
jgi:hypothetical protein